MIGTLLAVAFTAWFVGTVIWLYATEPRDLARCRSCGRQFASLPACQSHVLAKACDS